MIQYYGYTVSPNQIETGEGFLICRNVPIARTGEQKYLGREIGLTGAQADKIVTVYRSEEEVFSEAAMASFEGKPATNDHPPYLIGPDDVGLYEKGHVQNIRRGLGEWKDYILADLHIHNRELIEAIQMGKREISCGYECDYVSNGDGTYNQKNIRGNHIAVVDHGRAGKRAAILDSNTIKKEARQRPERAKMKKNGLFFKLFGQAVKDKSPEEIEQLAMDAAEALEEEDSKETEGKEGAEKKEAQDEAVIDGIVEKVMARLAAKETERNKTKDSIDTAIEKLTADTKEGQSENGSSEEQASRVIPAEEAVRAGGMDKSLALEILKTMRPTVAAIKDEAQRKAVSDALINLVAVKDSKDDISAILQASQKNAEKAAGKKPAAMDMEAIQKMYDNLNPHRRKETK
ncbi:MAG TPA: hypothetical protein DDY31_17780 [Lachnospiraceae bacterium]|nr:hypothetical protein [Lachnospiraceae bacterium]